MKNLVASFLLCLFATGMYGQCDHYWIKVKVQEDSSYSLTNPKYQVDIEVLMEDAGICDDFGQLPFKVYACNANNSYTASMISMEKVDSADQDCFALKHYAEYDLYKKTYRGSFTLDTVSCNSVLVYCERDSNRFANIEGADTLPVPVAGWVHFIPYKREPFPFTDPGFRVLETCRGMTKHFRPAYKNSRWPDTSYFEMVKAAHYDTSTSGPTKVARNYKGILSKNHPLMAQNFQVHNSKWLQFTPSDTGLMLLPMEIVNLRNDSVTIGFFMTSRTYWQMPVYVSDSCYAHLSTEQTFNTDTLSYSCDSVFSIPLNREVAVETISPDGSDFKFHNANGYPVIVKRAFPNSPHTTYTDTIKLKAQFFFDGYYEVEMLAGADGDKVISSCGYELLSQDRLTMAVSGCPNSVSTEEQDPAAALKVYPNPAGDFLFVESGTGIKRLRILNSAGSVVSDRKYSSSTKKIQRELGHLPSGLLFVQVYFGPRHWEVVKIAKK